MQEINNKLLGETKRSSWLGLVKEFLLTTPKAWFTKEKKIDKLDFIKIKTISQKDKAHTRRKYMQIICMIKILYLDYIKNFITK